MSRDGWEDGAESKELEPTPDLDTFARIHNIELGPILPRWSDRAWVAGLRRPGARTFLVLFERTHTNRSILTDILTSLATEAAAVETSIDEHEWARKTNLPLPEGQLARHSYLTARRQAKRLRAWLPVGVYETLLWQLTST